MPDVEGLRRRPFGDVSHDPLHLAGGSFAEPRFGGFEAGLRNIQHRHMLEPARDEAIDQARCAAADIDDGGFRRRPGKINQFERRRGIS